MYLKHDHTGVKCGGGGEKTRFVSPPPSEKCAFVRKSLPLKKG